MTKLDDLRRDIDRVDEVLVRLLNERARCVCAIGQLKKEQGIEVYQPDREKDVLKHVRDVACEGPLGP
jgi:chorismate mutase